MLNYIALLRKDSVSDYSIDFPDFPGCITAGRTLDEAKDMADEALQLHVEGLLEDGGELPSPSSLEVIMADPDNHDAVAFIVSVRTSRNIVRVNITIDEQLLERVDAVSRVRGLSRSGYFTYLANNDTNNNHTT